MNMATEEATGDDAELAILLTIELDNPPMQLAKHCAHRNLHIGLFRYGSLNMGRTGR